jgi:uncharacterized membrane protein
MKDLIKCKACGYIMGKGKLGDTCPACGVPKTAFEDYRETMSEKRKRILDMHLHPIIVHFPQAFGIAVPAFIVLGLILGLIPGDPFSGLLFSAVSVLVFFLPLFSGVAIIAGMIDGKTRFKKLSTIILKQKLITGIALLVLSTIAAIYSLINPVSSSSFVPVLVLSLLCVPCEIMLGNIGSKIIDSKLPG